MVYKFLNHKTAGGAVNKIIQNKELADELQKPVIRKFKKRRVYSSFIDIIWGVDLADMHLLSAFNKGICLYCVLLIFIANMLGLFL